MHDETALRNVWSRLLAAVVVFSCSVSSVSAQRAGVAPRIVIRSELSLPAGANPELLRGFNSTVYLGSRTGFFRLLQGRQAQHVSGSLSPNEVVVDLAFGPSGVRWVLTTTSLWRVDQEGKWEETAKLSKRFPGVTVLWCTSSAMGLVVGGMSGDPRRPFVAISANQGASWKVIDVASDRSIAALRAYGRADGQPALIPLTNDVLVGTAEGWELGAFPRSCNDAEYLDDPFGLRNHALFVLDGANAWLSADDWRVFHSRDGGRRWCLRSGVGLGFGYLKTLHFVSASTGVGIGALGNLMVTGDGGRTWSNSALPQAFIGVALNDKMGGWLTDARNLYSFRMER